MEVATHLWAAGHCGAISGSQNVLSFVMAVVSVLHSGTSKDPNMMVLRHLSLVAACHAVLCFYCLSYSGREIPLLTRYLVLIFSAFVFLHLRLPLLQIQCLHHC